MNTRSYALPTLSALSLVATGAACSKVDPVVGDWIAAEMTITYDGGSYAIQYPVTYSGTYDGVSYSYTQGIRMTVTEELSGQILTYYDYTANGTTEREEYTYQLVATIVERGQWRIESSEADLQMTCTADTEADKLDCDWSEEGDTYALSWTRAPAE